MRAVKDFTTNETHPYYQVIDQPQSISAAAIVKDGDSTLAWLWAKAQAEWV
jgi:hypothetical protein